MKKVLFVFLLGAAGRFHAQNCIDPSLIDPNAICPMIYAPVCGCDGVTYSNDCVAQSTGGVTSWSIGPCNGSGGCIDMSTFDFGTCEMLLGYSWNGSACVPISGCGYIIGNIDYSPNFYSSESNCIENCGNSIDCIDLSQIDFGLCDMFMGFGWSGGSCTAISGCGYLVGDVDYTSNFYATASECQQNCGDVLNDCVNSWQIEQGYFVDCAPSEDSICGCDGLTYLGICDAFYYGGVTTYALGACEDSLCFRIPDNIGFGDCDLNLGWALRESGCVETSGCGYIGQNGYDYSEYFFSSSYECGQQCVEDVVVECIDPTLIDPNVICTTIYDPVCGCDDITYSNDCVATYTGGVTIWTPGECFSGIQNLWQQEVKLFPNPFEEDVNIVLPATSSGQINVTDISGKILRKQSFSGKIINLDLGLLPPGMYFVEISDLRHSVIHKQIIKE